MPGFDGTGPNSMGPMTGGGRGYCAVPAGSVPVRPYGRGSWGRGGGRGRGRGFGRGFGWGRFASPYAYGYPYAADVTSEEEVRMLKDEASFLKQQMEDVQNHIKMLEKTKDSGKSE